MPFKGKSIWKFGELNFHAAVVEELIFIVFMQKHLSLLQIYNFNVYV